MAVVFIQDGDPAFISSGAGDDRYIVSALVAPDQVVTITDGEGANTLQLEPGIEITSSSTTSNFMVLNLSNGATIRITNADNFTFITGPTNTTTGEGGASETFSDFVTNSLGLDEVPTGDTAVEGPAATVESGGGTSIEGDETPEEAAAAAIAAAEAAATTAADSLAAAEAAQAEADAAEALVGDLATAEAYKAAADAAKAAADQAVADAEAASTSAAEAETAAAATDDTADDATAAALVADAATAVADAEAAQATAEAEVASAEADVDAFTPGDSFDFTASVDNLTGDASLNIFTADLTVAGTQTLQSFDSADGGGGTDILNAVMENGNTIDPTLENIEVINITSVETDNELDLVNSTGYEQLWSVNSQEDLQFSGVAELVTVGARGVVDNAVIEVDYDTGTVAAEDTQAFAVEDSVVQFNMDQVGTLNVENVSFTFAGENEVDFDSTAFLDNTVIQNVMIMGSGSFALDEAIAAGNVDASGATGDLGLEVADIAASNTEDNDVTTRTVVLGSGNDRLQALGNITDQGSFDGGDGDDAVVVDGTSGTVGADLAAYFTNFETVELDGINQAIDLDDLADFDAVIATNANAVAELENVTATSDVTLVNTGGTSTIDLDMGTDETDLSITTLNDNGTTNTDFNITTDAETLAVDLTATEDAPGSELILTAAALETITLTGVEDVTMDVSGLATVTDVDASAVDGDSSITVGDGVTLMGGAGDDILGFDESGMITGGAGADSFRLVDSTETDAGGAATETNAPLFSTIMDLSASDEDEIQFVAGGPVTVSTDDTGTAVNVIEAGDLGLAPGVTAVFTDFLQQAADQGGGGVVSGFVFEGNTYLVSDVAAATTYDEAADFIVELSGTSVDLTEWYYA